MADLLSLKIKISGIGSKLMLSSCTSCFKTQVEVFIMPKVITEQPIAADLNIPEGLPLADLDFRQPGPIDLTLGVEVFSRVISGELLEL